MTSQLPTDLITPYGGVLQDLLAGVQQAEYLKKEAVQLPSWDLNERQVTEIELLINGGFSPLRGFMGERDYDSVCTDMRLGDGTLWPLPVILDVTEEFAQSISQGARVALRHPEGMVLAVLTVSEMWSPDRDKEARLVYGTGDDVHPGVFRIIHQANPVYIGGSVEGVELPEHHVLRHLRNTPAQLRALFQGWGWARVVAFQARTPMHKAHIELTKQAAAEAQANLLIHPTLSQTGTGDADRDFLSRVRCYEAIMKYYPDQGAALGILPLAMRMAGPREAIWHAIVGRNYGCTHLIVGLDHAGAGDNRVDKAFYEPFAAQELFSRYENELGVKMVAMKQRIYTEDIPEYKPSSVESKNANALSARDLREMLEQGLDVPEWFSYPEVIGELRKLYPSKKQQGFTVFFTGLPSSGKSTLANTLVAKLMEAGSRPVTLLDGDIVRKHLSSELGFSREHRDLNIMRIGFVASEITKHRGIAICAPIAPYRNTRREVRELINSYGGFIQVYVATPVEICEARDRKGLYAKARAGLITGFTGIDDPYEVPENPEVVVDTTGLGPEEAVNEILLYLGKMGFIEF